MRPDTDFDNIKPEFFIMAQKVRLLNRICVLVTLFSDVYVSCAKPSSTTMGQVDPGSPATMTMHAPGRFHNDGAPVRRSTNRINSNANLTYEGTPTNASMTYEGTQANASVTNEGAHANASMTYEGAHANASMTYKGTQANASIAHESTQTNARIAYEGTHANTSMAYKVTYANASMAYKGTHANASITFEGAHANVSMAYEGAHANASTTYEGTHANASMTYEGTHANARMAYEGTHANVSMAYEGTQANASMTHKGTHANASMTYEGKHANASMAYEGTHANASMAYEGTHANASMTYEGTHANASMAYEGTQANASMTYEGAHANVSMAYEGRHSNASMTYEGAHDNASMTYEGEQEYLVLSNTTIQQKSLEGSPVSTQVFQEKKTATTEKVRDHEKQVDICFLAINNSQAQPKIEKLACAIPPSSAMTEMGFLKKCQISSPWKVIAMTPTACSRVTKTMVDAVAKHHGKDEKWVAIKNETKLALSGICVAARKVFGKGRQTYMCPVETGMIDLSDRAQLEEVLIKVCSIPAEALPTAKITIVDTVDECVDVDNAYGSASGPSSRLKSSYRTLFILTLVISLAGVILNLTAIFVLVKGGMEKTAKSNPSWYFISMLSADIVHVVSSGVKAAVQLGIIGLLPAGLCQLIAILPKLGFIASTNVILAITIERYIVVCHPLKVKQLLTKSNQKKVKAPLIHQW